MGLIQPTNWDDSNIDPAVEARIRELVAVDKLPHDHIMRRIDRGRKGLNVGGPTMGPLGDKCRYGIHQGMYYLMGADSSVGKTTIADFMAVLNAYWQAKLMNRKLYLFYY